MKQLHVYFSGHVQGVGFRYTTLGIARNLNLTGWVCNLSDGRVEAIVEGQETILNEFLKEIAIKFDGHIKNINHHFNDATHQYKEFTIKY